MNTVFLDQKFHSIQSLRGIAALFVVISHFSFIGVGAFGVDIFFCISGFIMIYVTEKDKKHFLSKRLIRILPLYYLMTIFTYLLLLIFPQMFFSSTADMSYLIKSFFFIPYEIGDVIQPIVRVGWTINYEMFFYLLFFLSMKISHKYRSIICSTLLLVLASLGEIFTFSNVFLKFYCNELLLEFILGMIAFYIGEKIYNYFYKINKKSGKMYWCALCILITLLGFTWLVKTTNYESLPHFSRVILWGLPAFAIFLAMFTLGCIIQIPKWLSFTGDISFSIYLIHYYPVMLFSRITEKYDSLSIKLLLGGIEIVLIIIISSISYYIIEKKLSSALRKWLKI